MPAIAELQNRAHGALPRCHSLVFLPVGAASRRESFGPGRHSRHVGVTFPADLAYKRKHEPTKALR